MAEKSLQERYAPRSVCFGCGPANARGLRIRSFSRGEEVVCDWTPQEHHHAFDGFLSGGITGTILDCHSNWAAACALMGRNGLTAVPSTVTVEFSVRFLRPTPLAALHLRARAVEVGEERAVVESSVEAGGKTTATFRGTFAVVKEGHPAYGRWG